jgi:NADH-quinone oxidoreductase subunit M
MVVMGSLTVVIIWLGLFPSPVLRLSENPVRNIIEKVNQSQTKSAQNEAATTDYMSVRRLMKEQHFNTKNKNVNTKE